MSDKDREVEFRNTRIMAKAAIVVAVIALITQVVNTGLQGWGSERARVRQARWELKRTACLKGLDMVDDSLVHRLSGGRESRRFTGREIRELRYEMALACENPEVVNLFMELITAGQSVGNPGVRTDRILDFLNGIRKELSFGKDLRLDREAAWVGTIAIHGTNVETLLY